MKKLLSALLAVAFLTGCAATYDGPTAEQAVCSRMRTTYYDSDGMEIQTYYEEYTYDIFGNRVQTLAYRNDKLCEKTVLRYDENGNTTRHIRYDLSGWFPNKVTDTRYTYDDLGRQISSTYRSSGERSTVTTVYDNEALTRTVTASGSVAVDYLNDQGWVIRTEQTFSDGRTCVTEYDRGPDGQLLSMDSYENGVLISESVYTYDDQGRVLTLSETTDAGTELLIRYEYGERDMVQYNADGSHIATTYNDDGSIHYFYHADSADRITQDGMYYYTTIRIPAEEVSP